MQRRLCTSRAAQRRRGGLRSGCRRGLVAVMVLVLLSAMIARPARCDTFVVTKTADTNDGLCNFDCSLREAVIAANAQPGADTIVLGTGEHGFSIAGAGEDLSATGDLDIRETVEIRGVSSSSTFIDANQLDRALEVIQGEVTLSHLTVTGGFDTARASCGGISVRDQSALNLDHVTVAGNESGGAAALGGGICNLGITSITNSLITLNTSTGAFARGGGIFNGFEAQSGVPVAQLTVSDSIISDNSATGVDSVGGGIANGFWSLDWVGETTVIRSVIQANHADGGGGGLFFDQLPPGVVAESVISDTEISGNTADGGAGIFNGHDLFLFGSTVSDNLATNGGGIFTGVELNAVNCTISGNIALAGGGLYLAAGTATLGTCTLSANTAPSGSAVFSSGTLIPIQTIVDGSCSVQGGLTSSAGYNIESPADTCLLSAQTDRVGVSGAALALDGLADNGGFTPTHALLPQSVAIDTVGTVVCPGIDQRGIPRPLDGDGSGTAECDVGAFEYGGIFADGFESGGTSAWSNTVP